MDYADKIFTYLHKKPEGWKMSISTLTDNPEKFINTVKMLIDEGSLPDICFSNDYKTIKKY